MFVNTHQLAVCVGHLCVRNHLTREKRGSSIGLDLVSSPDRGPTIEGARCFVTVKEALLILARCCVLGSVVESYLRRFSSPNTGLVFSLLRAP